MLIGITDSLLPRDGPGWPTASCCARTPAPCSAHVGRLFRMGGVAHIRNSGLACRRRGFQLRNSSERTGERTRSAKLSVASWLHLLWPRARSIVLGLARITGKRSASYTTQHRLRQHDMSNDPNRRHVPNPRPTRSRRGCRVVSLAGPQSRHVVEAWHAQRQGAVGARARRGSA